MFIRCEVSLKDATHEGFITGYVSHVSEAGPGSVKLPYTVAIVAIPTSDDRAHVREVDLDKIRIIDKRVFED